MDHEIPVRIVDNQEYMKVVRSILEEGKEVPLVVTGNSMMPFLIDRRDQVLIKFLESIDRISFITLLHTNMCH